MSYEQPSGTNWRQDSADAQSGQGYPVAPKPGNGLGITGMVIGILSIVFFWIPILDWVLAILAIIFGGCGFRSTQGKAGVITGIVGLILPLIILIAVASSDTSHTFTP